MRTLHILRYLAIAFVVGGLIWISAAFFKHGRSAEPSPDAKQLRPLHVQLKWLHQGQFAGFYVAQEKGYFRQHGLEVTLSQGGPGNNAITAVLAGTADVGVWGSEQVL